MGESGWRPAACSIVFACFGGGVGGYGKGAGVRLSMRSGGVGVWEGLGWGLEVGFGGLGIGVGLAVKKGIGAVGWSEGSLGAVEEDRGFGDYLRELSSIGVDR